MDVRIFVETVFENGEALTRDVGHICRPLDDAGPESLGLHLHEAKSLLPKYPISVERVADGREFKFPVEDVVLYLQNSGGHFVL